MMLADPDRCSQSAVLSSPPVVQVEADVHMQGLSATSNDNPDGRSVIGRKLWLCERTCLLHPPTLHTPRREKNTAAAPESFDKHLIPIRTFIEHKERIHT